MKLSFRLRLYTRSRSARILPVWRRLLQPHSRNVIDALCRLLQIRFRLYFLECTREGVLALKIFLMLYRFLIRSNFSETLFPYRICTESRAFWPVLVSFLWTLMATAVPRKRAHTLWHAIWNEWMSSNCWGGWENSANTLTHEARQQIRHQRKGTQWVFVLCSVETKLL
jgi:hypothetical protein